MRTNGFHTPTGLPAAARIGIAGLGGFALAVLVSSAFKPGYSHVREAMSALAAMDSPAAPVMIAGFLAAAVGLVAVGAGLWRRLSTGIAGRVSAALVMIGGGLMAAAGLARQDCSERLASCIDHGEAPLASGHFWVHQFVSLALFVLLTIALFVMARGLRRSEGWRHLARPTRFAGLFAVLCIACLVADPAFLAPYAGLVQRAFLLVLFGWPLLVASLPARTGDDEPAGGRAARPARAGRPRSTVLTERSVMPVWSGSIESARPAQLP